MSSRKYRSDSLTVEEETRFLEVVDRLEDLALFELELCTGIRREDIVGIEVDSVNLEKRSIRFWEHKKRAWHTVPIASKVMPTLKRHLNSLSHGQRRLFTFTGRTAWNRLQRYLRRAGISKKLCFHDLRRTFVKNAKKKGLSVKAVAQITGDRYETVEEYYANLDDDELRQEADKL